MSASYHDLHTPISRAAVTKYIGTSVPPKGSKEYASSDVPYSADIVESISYYFENSEDMSAYDEPAGDVSWEISSTWKLLMELHQMEAVHEACMNDPESISATVSNPIRNAFMTIKSFRKLVAVIHWLNWVNSFEEVPHVEPSSSAYPLSNGEFPIDTPPDQLNGKDVQRERTLCRAVWTLLTQGKVAEAIDLCAACGHNWRAGVLQAAVGTDEDDYLVEYDMSRFTVKEIAKEICSSTQIGSDPYDVAITGFLCAEEGPMRNVISGKSFALNLWASLYCLKEKYVALILTRNFEDIEKNLSEELQSILLSQSMSLDNQFGQIQIALILGDFNSAINICLEWDIDLAGNNPLVAVLLRSFSANLITVYRDVIGDKSIGDESASIIIQNQIESLLAQYKTQLIEGNEIIIETISLLKNFNMQINAWAWYLKQYIAYEDDSAAESALSALIDVFPNGAIPVMNLLMSELIEKNLPVILSRSVASSVTEGAEIKFALLATNTVWLLVQSRAKSHGSGIYLDVVGEDEDPESAAEKTVLAFADLMGEGLIILVLADFNSAKLVAHELMSQPTGKILSIYAAIEEDPNHFIMPLFSFIHVLDRVGAIMERSSLLEQQEANLVKLSNKTGRSVGTETRRQILETQRSIAQTSDMIAKLVDEITTTLSEYLKEDQCPLICEKMNHSVVPAVIEVLIESSIQAVALFDDRKKHAILASAVRDSKWIPAVINSRRLDEILEEIAND